jgi:thymidylate synthase ThyX
MGFGAKVLADSLSPAGVRLTTLEVTMPRIVLAEFNTHRMFSRSSASSRAIPVPDRIAAVRRDPFIPAAFGKNQRGMQAATTLAEGETKEALSAWTSAMDTALFYAGRLAELEVHKQLANRLLEPFSWHTVIVTATEWQNFWGLRISPLAQPEIAEPARLMKLAMDASVPKPVPYGGWHLPLVPDLEELQSFLSPEEVCKVSVARCARVSYLTHDGKRDVQADVKLFERLASNGHMSPLEHVATPLGWEGNVGSEVAPGWETSAFSGNFRGWKQLRKDYPHEADFSAREAST